MKHLPIVILAVFCMVGCHKAGKTAQDADASTVSFSRDSAWQYVQDQISLGARVPGSTAHMQCAQYLQAQLRRFGAETEVQQGQMTDYKGDMQQVVNIVGHYGNSDKRRVLLCAHWDSRPWADQEEEYDNRMMPVLGANDGASGVGVLLEIARQTGLHLGGDRDKEPAVDIVLFDCEDMGTPTFYTGKEREDTWCLGSQMWAKENKARAKSYKYGILLDMVGAPDAVFPKEYYSMAYAPNVTEQVWRNALRLGYGALFRDIPSYPVTDDHYYINTIAGIPCVDIIHYDPHYNTGFAHWWHTLNDNMSNISPATLEAVGKTVMAIIQN